MLRALDTYEEYIYANDYYRNAYIETLSAHIIQRNIRKKFDLTVKKL